MRRLSSQGHNGRYCLKGQSRRSKGSQPAPSGVRGVARNSSGVPVGRQARPAAQQQQAPAGLPHLANRQDAIKALEVATNLAKKAQAVLNGSALPLDTLCFALFQALAGSSVRIRMHGPASSDEVRVGFWRSDPFVVKQARAKDAAVLVQSHRGVKTSTTMLRRRQALAAAGCDSPPLVGFCTAASESVVRTSHSQLLVSLRVAAHARCRVLLELLCSASRALRVCVACLLRLTALAKPVDMSCLR